MAPLILSAKNVKLVSFFKEILVLPLAHLTHIKIIMYKDVVNVQEIV